jgi:hypothetical protein
VRKVALATQERRQGYNDGRAYAAKLVILSKKDATRVLTALSDEGTKVDVIQGSGPYYQSYIKGFRRRMIERCEFYLAHADE